MCALLAGTIENIVVMGIQLYRYKQTFGAVNAPFQNSKNSRGIFQINKQNRSIRTLP